MIWLTGSRGLSLGFAGGAMIWIIFAELISDANEETEAPTVAAVVTISIIAMLVFQIVIT